MNQALALLKPQLLGFAVQHIDQDRQFFRILRWLLCLLRKADQQSAAGLRDGARPTAFDEATFVLQQSHHKLHPPARLRLDKSSHAIASNGNGVWRFGGHQ